MNTTWCNTELKTDADDDVNLWTCSVINHFNPIKCNFCHYFIGFGEKGTVKKVQKMDEKAQYLGKYWLNQKKIKADQGRYWSIKCIPHGNLKAHSHKER